MIRKWFASFLSLFAFAPSLVKTQKANRLALADHLEQNVSDDKYEHSMFYNPRSGRGCALAHAGAARIGGMALDPHNWRVPILSADMDGSRRSYSVDDSKNAATLVFGAGTYTKIFESDNGFTRTEAITALRNFKPIAA